MHGNNRGRDYQLPSLGVDKADLEMLAKRANEVGRATQDPEQFAIAGALFALAGAMGDPETLDEINAVVMEIAQREMERAYEQEMQDQRVSEAMGYGGYGGYGDVVGSECYEDYGWPTDNVEAMDKERNWANDEPEDPTFAQPCLPFFPDDL